MKCLVTGNLGFVGSNLIQYLVSRGHDPIGFDRIDNYPTTEVIYDFIKRHNVNKIYHLGARAFIPDCYGLNIESVVNSNVVFTASLLKAAKMAEVKRLVYLSTSEVYGNSETIPIDENTPVNPISTYAATKFAAENLVRTFSYETGFETSVLRHFNIYGPEDTQPRVIPKLMSAAKHNKIIKLGSVDATRDFSYVRDVCVALENIMEFKYCDNFVRGSGKETSITELIDLISHLYNTEIVYEEEIGLQRPMDVKRLVADSSKYLSTFPEHLPMDLKTGLEYTKKWYDNHDWKWEKNERKATQ